MMMFDEENDALIGEMHIIIIILCLGNKVFCGFRYIYQIRIEAKKFV